MRRVKETAVLCTVTRVHRVEHLQIITTNNYATGPKHSSAKHVPELEKILETVYRQWRGVL
jgi:hypothetical protein